MYRENRYIEMLERSIIKAAHSIRKLGGEFSNFRSGRDGPVFSKNMSLLPETSLRPCQRLFVCQSYLDKIRAGCTVPSSWQDLYDILNVPVLKMPTVSQRSPDFHIPQCLVPARRAPDDPNTHFCVTGPDIPVIFAKSRFISSKYGEFHQQFGWCLSGINIG